MAPSGIREEYLFPILFYRRHTRLGFISKKSKIVRQLNNKFGVDVDIPDKSVKFFPQASHCLRFIFLVGTTSADDVIASILRF